MNKTNLCKVGIKHTNFNALREIPTERTINL